MLSLLFVSLLASGPAFQSQAQSMPAIEIPAADVIQELELNDGSSIIGRVESIGAGRFVFRTTSGTEMTVDVATVRSLKPVSGRIVHGQLWREDPNTTRLFFGPTGRSLKKGEAYFGVYEVLLPFVQVGITDRLSIGAGTPLIFGDFDHPFWVTPKFQVMRQGSTSASIGVMHFFNVDDESLGIGYAALTQGSTDSALTVGVGYAYSRGAEADHGSSVLMIGGEHRLSRRIKFITENYAFKDGVMGSAGVRFFGEKLSADFGLVLVPFDEGIGVGPMVNIVRKF
jgi:hypothetical protein